MAIGAIAEQLAVAKSSVSRWVRDIELTSAQAARLAALDPVRNGRLLGMRRSVERRRAERLAAQAPGRALARSTTRSIARGACSTGRMARNAATRPSW